MSEALALTYEDIDREKKLITVNKKIIHDGNYPTLVHETKTEAGTREVILFDRVKDLCRIRKQALYFATTTVPITQKSN